MKSLCIISGIFIIIFICLIPLKRNILEYKVQKNGQLITAQIAYIPHPLGCKLKYSMKFLYSGRAYLKTVGCNFDQHYKVGDFIKLKHLKGGGIFLFESENIVKEFIAFALLAVFGAVLIIYGIVKK